METVPAPVCVPSKFVINNRGLLNIYYACSAYKTHTHYLTIEIWIHGYTWKFCTYSMEMDILLPFVLRISPLINIINGMRQRKKEHTQNPRNK